MSIQKGQPVRQATRSLRSVPAEYFRVQGRDPERLRNLSEGALHHP